MDPFSDKENQAFKSEDFSFYDNNTASENPSNFSPSRCALHCPHGLEQERRVLDFHDHNSQDSGYSTSYVGDKASSSTSPGKLGSFGSLASMEDEYFEFFDMEPLDRSLNLPKDFTKLVANPIVNRSNTDENQTSPNEIRPLFRRALSLHNAPATETTPVNSKVRMSLFQNRAGRRLDELRNFKRCDPPSSTEKSTKKSRVTDDDDAFVPVGRPILQRAISATEESIMCAVQRSSTEPDLIGDYSKNCSLPLTISRHQDLKAISADTLFQVLKGEFQNSISSFKVIDCRYPYEYDGGHIEGAVNIYTREQCVALLDGLKLPSNLQKQNVLIFHCEFSSERGPNLCRFLRREDRHRNEDAYPSLFYPEIYLLEGGYKNFFEKFSQMCTPNAYKQMLHPDHEQDLKFFRQISKTLNNDSRLRFPTGKSRQRLGM